MPEPVVQPVVPEAVPAPVVPPVTAALPVEPVTPPAAPTEPTAPSGEAFEPTGDAGLDLAASWIQGLGIAADDPAIIAAMDDGNFDFLKAKLASLGDKARGWEQYIALAEKGMGNLKTTATAKANETLGVIHEAVGGAEAWEPIKEWASANADPAEKEAINAMFEQGGLAARAAASLLNSMYQQAAGTTVEPMAATTSAPASSKGTNAALSPSDYAAELNKLAAKIGSHRLDDSPEYAALRQRRLAYQG